MVAGKINLGAVSFPTPPPERLPWPRRRSAPRVRAVHARSKPSVAHTWFLETNLGTVSIPCAIHSTRWLRQNQPWCDFFGPRAATDYQRQLFRASFVPIQRSVASRTSMVRSRSRIDVGASHPSEWTMVLNEVPSATVTIADGTSAMGQSQQCSGRRLKPDWLTARNNSSRI